MENRMIEMDLYDFAKQALNGREPASVTFLESDRKTIRRVINFDPSPDQIPSVVFSYNDSFTNIMSVKSTVVDFPGLT
jgi:hypothetical protein